MPAGAIVTVTCLTAGLTTIVMGLYANLPFALASGMGLNAFFAYTCSNRDESSMASSTGSCICRRHYFYYIIIN